MTIEARWFGELPADWVVAPVGARYSVQLGKMLNPEAAAGPGLAPYLRNVDVQWGHVNTEDLPTMSFDADERLKFALRRGDILVCEGGEVGRAVIWHEELPTCFYQKALHRLRPLRATENPGFVVYVLRAAAWRGVFEAEGNRSTIFHLTAEKLRAHRFPFPPPSQQRRIVAFLDRKTAAIDQLIQKKERLIELLQEKRQALITQAVTKGLDPSVPMKESGVQWSGLVPQHWTVKAIKWASSVKRGASPRPIDDAKYFSDSGDFAWVRIEDVTAGRGLLETTSQRLSWLGSTLSVRLEPGAFFLSIAGSVGKPCISKIRCCIHDGFVYFPGWHGDARFLFFLGSSRK